MTQDQNMLYYGDNLEVLRRHIAKESVDLVYLDPPFNSNATYNVLFAEQDGTRAASQIKAFDDTWQWDQSAAAAYQEVVESGGPVSRAMQAFRTFLGDSNLLAYLAMMAPRLVELKRVLKPNGSIYLHCDPTASHYLKMLMDAVFGPENFRSEIIWKRSSAHCDAKQGSKQHGRIHDVILFYSRDSQWTWNWVYTAYDEDYVASSYRYIEAETGRKFKSTDLTAAKPGGDTSYEWNGRVPPEGRYWAYSRENMKKFDEQGLLHYTSTGLPRLKQYLDEMPGVPIQDLWTDISPIASQAAERLGYPTQKPEALLERIITASSNEGDVVLDPFCGCGTAIAAAQKLNRRWVGIDITCLATNLIKIRLHDTFGTEAQYKIVGEPVSVTDAQNLAAADPYQFQWWALGLVGARPAEGKKGADRGIDGRLYFHDEAENGATKQVIFSVKAGGVSVAHVRDLRGVMERENAEIGVLISMEEPTKPMRAEAAGAGLYKTEWSKKGHPRIQLLTVKDLLDGKAVDLPRFADLRTFKKAPKAPKPKKFRKPEAWLL